MMRFVLTKDAVDRTTQTVQAAGVFHDKARVIARTCAMANAGEVVVAVVEPNGVFGGAWPAPRSQLHARVAALDSDGWVLLFSAGEQIDDIEARCLGLARQAFRRWEAMRQWASRHA